MADTPSPDLRIGDPEREEAIRVLGDHLSLGRLTVDEYGERSARATAARTRGDLLQLFADLPEPHPRLDQSLVLRATAQPAEPHESRPDRVKDRQPLAPRIASALVPLSALLALALFFGAGASWIVFLIPAAMAVITGALWGEHGKKQKDHRHRI